MSYDSETHHRRSIRLRAYDYRQSGAYFVTICVQDRACLFGNIVNGGVQLNTAGYAVEQWWHQLPCKFPGVAVDALVVMPNHLHGIIMIGTHPVGADQRVCPLSEDRDSTATIPTRPSLPTIVQWLKTMTTNDYIRGVNTLDWPQFRKRLWQRNYYEHVIRDDRDLDRIRAYIAANPDRWAEDTENPHRLPP